MRTDIPKKAIELIQQDLQTKGLYNGSIDGIRTVSSGTSQTDRAVHQALLPRQTELTFKPSETSIQSWTGKRSAVAYFQLLMKDAGQDVGPVDGFWGPQTDVSYDLFIQKLAPTWRDNKDSTPSPVNSGNPNPNGWPSENASSLSRFYGSPCQVPLKRVSVPWTMKLAWDKSTRVSTVSIHEKCADSLNRVFNEIAQTYSAKEITDYGLDMYGGSYNCRKKRGGSSMSTHSWGIAIDWDPQRNQLSWGANRAFLARPELRPFWDIWEKEGWNSLGREKNYDWMHVQAARI